MRLLQATSDNDFSLVEYFDDIPPYAILSHTWGADHEEVTFKDIYKRKGKGKTKSGYEKLRFCAAQAARDGLKFFWVDTCCIDKGTRGIRAQQNATSISRTFLVGSWISYGKKSP